MPLTTLMPDPVTEVLHGVAVADPYRWLEDRTSPLTEQWIAEEKVKHDKYFAEIAGLDGIRARVDAYLNVEVIDQPVRVGQQLFFRRRKKNQEQACICVRGAIKSDERVLIDPSPHGSFASVAIHCVSTDGDLLAYELKQGGSDATEIHFVVTATGQILSDYLSLGYPRGLTFVPDGSGFFYCHEDLSRTADHEIRLHEFSSESEDTVLFRNKRTPRSRIALRTDGVRLGVICRREDGAELRSDFYVADNYRSAKWMPVFRNRSLPYEPFLHRGRIFVFTEDRAPNGILIELSDDGTEIGVIVPESESRIEQFVLSGEAIYVRYLRERKSVIRGWNLEGTCIGDLPLPCQGTIQILSGIKNSPGSLFYTYESFTEPPCIYEYQPCGRNSVRFGQAAPSVDARSYRVDEEWYTSYDGTRIPIFLVRNRELDPETSSPVVMTGYGGFGVSMTPKFSVLVTILLELGAIFALPGIRGGAEFGRPWHQSARGRTRQVAFSDFIAAAEWISNWHGTCSRRLGIFGGSNSGLLVATATTQRPDLFRAVLCIAPLLDMLRYEHFDNARKWRQEYGTVDDPEDFIALHGYSPYHHVRDDVNYPATLFIAGDKDDRCNPCHVRKMAGRLQSRAAQTAPILVDYSAQRGHSPVLPLSVRTEALARRVAFLCHELEIPFPSGGSR
jgi:prolyl oligopeptidase